MPKPKRTHAFALIAVLALLVALSIVGSRPPRHVSEVRPQRVTAIATPRVTPAPTATPRPTATPERTVVPTPKPTPVDDVTAVKVPSLASRIRACASESCRRKIIEPIVRATWPGPKGSVEGLVSRIGCESQWSPWAVSATDDHGLTQLNGPTWRDDWAGWTDTEGRSLGPWQPNVYNVRRNVIGAYHVYREAGGSFSPWSCGR